MEFDPANTVIQLCAKGMELELNQQPDEAKRLFLQAWEMATTDVEKFTAAHYVARHQSSVAEKLKWDQTALSFALKIEDSGMAANYASLYLNIAKCYEDLADIDNAKMHYQLALSYEPYLPINGYGQIILSGIKNGIERVGGL